MSNNYADLVLTGGNVLTVDAKNSRAQAVAVKFGKILAVGTKEDIKPFIGKETRVIDVGGRTVIPGLIDAHCHAFSSAREAMDIDCGPLAVKSIADIKKAFAERAKKAPKGKWIKGYGLDDTKLAEKRLLTRADLDEVAPDNPAWVTQVSGHIGMLNSPGLKAGGLSESSPDPVGGKLGRDPATGKLNGIVYEAAMSAYCRGRNPVIPAPTPEEDREAVRLVGRWAASLGITSFAEAITDPGMFQSFQAARSAGDLKVRIYMLFGVEFFNELLGTGIRTGFGDEWLRFGAVKILGDGAIAGRTAYLSEPYVGTKDDYGIMAVPPDILNEEVMAAHRAGYQIAIHANGDKYIEHTLDAYEKALAAYPRENHRHRIEHCTVMNPALMARMKRLGIMSLPFGSYVYYHGEKMGFYGEKRLGMMFAHRSFLDAGVPVGGSSDYPCAPWPPLAGIQSCITRKSHTGVVLAPAQRISPEEALRLYTMGGAYASFEEKIKGSIEPGKLADMTVLGEDLTKVNPDTIKDIPVLLTMVGGEIMLDNLSR